VLGVVVVVAVVVVVVGSVVVVVVGSVVVGVVVSVTVWGDEDVVVGAADRDVEVSGVSEVDSVGESPPVISFARP
jgi:hypothetical protein